MRLLRAALPAFACGLLVACASSPRPPAPVFDRPVTRTNVPKPAAAPAPQKPETHTVKRGDTLYSIALENGVDYRDLAAWNGLADPSVLKEGTVLRLRPSQAPPLLGLPETRTPAQADSGVQVQPIVTPGAVEARALGEQRSPAEPPRASGTPLAPAEAPKPELLKTGPKAVKLPYSEDNVAAVMRLSPPEATAEAEAAPGPTTQSDGVDWMWPATGKVLANLPKGANKGVDILGKIGDPVFASAAGRVVYSGTGLRGYGKLVIIKHNETYLSTYAHNSNLLVKQGDNVVKGQKIAEIGNTDSTQAKLTFEIRRMGKPVDPLQLLPEKRS